MKPQPLQGKMLNGTKYDNFRDCWMCGVCKQLFTYEMVTQIIGNPRLDEALRTVYYCPNLKCHAPVFEGDITMK